MNKLIYPLETDMIHLLIGIAAAIYIYKQFRAWNSPEARFSRTFQRSLRPRR